MDEKTEAMLRNNPEFFLQDLADITVDGDCMEPAELVREIYQMVSNFLGRKDKRPYCPDCNSVMIKCHRDDIPEMGWYTYWKCDCMREVSEH